LPLSGVTTLTLAGGIKIPLQNRAYPLQKLLHHASQFRMMPDCLVITTQNTRELYGCAEGLSVAYVNQQKMKRWLEGFPGALNDTGDLPVIKRDRYDCLFRSQ